MLSSANNHSEQDRDERNGEIRRSSNGWTTWGCCTTAVSKIGIAATLADVLSGNGTSRGRRIRRYSERMFSWFQVKGKIKLESKTDKISVWLGLEALGENKNCGCRGISPLSSTIVVLCAKY